MNENIGKNEEVVNIEPTRIRRAKRYDFTRWRVRKACDKIVKFGDEGSNWFGTPPGATSDHALGSLSIAGQFLEQALFED